MFPCFPSLVIKGAGLGFAMPIGPLLGREPNERDHHPKRAVGAIECRGLLGHLHVLWSRLTPLVFARKAVRLMNTDDLAALGTGPLFLFVPNELPQADLL
jgi:hypothetical protein